MNIKEKADYYKKNPARLKTACKRSRIVEVLGQALKDKNISQTQAAEVIGLDQGKISLILVHKRALKAEELLLLIEEFKLWRYFVPACFPSYSIDLQVVNNMTLDPIINFKMETNDFKDLEKYIKPFVESETE